jgi:hypothetical protein
VLIIHIKGIMKPIQSRMKLSMAQRLFVSRLSVERQAVQCRRDLVLRASRTPERAQKARQAFMTDPDVHSLVKQTQDRLEAAVLAEEVSISQPLTYLTAFDAHMYACRSLKLLCKFLCVSASYVMHPCNF